MADVSADIERQRKLLGPGPKTLHAGPGTITRPIVLEPFENLHLCVGTYHKADYYGLDLSPSSPMIAPKGYNRIWGDGPGTVIIEPRDVAATDPVNAPSTILQPWFGSNLNPLSSAFQPMFHNIHVSDFQVQSNLSVVGNGSRTLLTIGNCNGGGFERIYMNGVHAIGIALGGGSNSSGGPYNIKGFGRRQYIKNCTFVGGNTSEIAAGSAGVMCAVVNSVCWEVSNNTFERVPNGSSAIDIEVNGDDDQMGMGLIQDNNVEIRRDMGPGYEYRDHEYDGPDGNYPAAQFSTYGFIIHAAAGQAIGPIKVTGNQIRGAWNAPGTMIPGRSAIYGIYCPGPYGYGWDISNNTIDTCGVGIHFEGSHSRIAGNLISHGGSNPAAAIRFYGRHGRVNHNVIQYYSNASGYPLIEEIMLPGREDFTDWNNLSDNVVEHCVRVGNNPFPPSVVLAKEGNPLHAPNSTKGGKWSGNQQQNYDSDQWMAAADLL